MTDAPSRQDPPENEDGQPATASGRNAEGGAQQPASAPASAPAATAPQSPQWSSDQPAPAPWYLGKPGSAPPPYPFPAAPPLPPPNADQANWPNQPPGTRPEDSGAAGQAPQQQPQQPQDSQPPQQSQPQPQPPQQPSSGVPPWTGQAPPNPQQPYPGPPPPGWPQQGQPPNGQQPGQQSGPPYPAPWHDPNRYAKPGNRSQQQGPPQRPPYGPPDRQREQQQSRRGEPDQRPELSLRTRWARGLAVGGFACTVITVLNGYENFSAWLIGASVGLGLSLSGLWFGTFAQRDAARDAKRAPEAVAAIVWSSISSLMALSLLSLSLIFYPQLSQYSDCMRSANTISGQQACQNQLDNSMTFKP